MLIAVAQAFMPADVRALRGVAVAAVGYVTNWYLVFSNQPYFETVGRPQLLQHLWSLAVEEQFYLIWPPMLLLMLRVGRRRGALAMTGLLALGSAALMAVLYRGGADASRLYYGTDTHAVGLLAGSALAMVEPLWRAREGRRWQVGYQYAGAGALIATFALFAWLAEWRPFLYQGGFVVTALVSLVLIVAATVRGPFATAIGSAPFRWVGLRSYSFYLWHPAALALVGASSLALPPPALAGLAAVLTVVVADLSYRWVETPIRTGTVWHAVDEFLALRPDTRWALGVASVAAGMTVIIGAAFAPAPATPSYLAVAQVSGVLVAPARAEVTAPAQSPTAAAPTAVASPLTPPRTTPQRTPTAGLTVRSLSAVVTPTPQPVASIQPVTSVDAVPVPGAPGTPTPSTGAVAKVFAIGDSVMLGATNDLARAFGTIEVDAAIGRDAATMVRILRERRAANRLPELVIVQVGNNGPLTRPQMDEMMSLLSAVPRVVVVDLRVPQPWEASNNTMLADAVAHHANARLVAWHRASDSREELLWDNIHLRPAGAELYVSLIVAQAQ